MAAWMLRVGCLWLLPFCCAALALATSKVILQDDNGDNNNYRFAAAMKTTRTMVR